PRTTTVPHVRARPIRAGSPALPRLRAGSRRPEWSGRPARRATPGPPCVRVPARGSQRVRVGCSRPRRERAEEARVLAGVTRAVALLLDLEQEHVAVAVEARLSDELDVAGRVALVRDFLP